VILKNVYNGEGKITEQEDGLKHLWKLEYKPGETTVTEPEGGKRKYGFDGQNRVVSETDQLGHTTTIAYDETGNVKEVVQPGAAKWEFGRDSAGSLTSVKDPEGGEREYEYDGKNRLTHFTDAVCRRRSPIPAKTSGKSNTTQWSGRSPTPTRLKGRSKSPTTVISSRPKSSTDVVRNDLWLRPRRSAHRSPSPRRRRLELRL
jgi:YD repeat-containing protein